MKKTGKILAALGLAVAFGAILNPTQAKAEDTDRIAQEFILAILMSAV